MTEITDKQLEYMSTHNLCTPYRFEHGNDVYISDLATALLKSRQDNAALAEKLRLAEEDAERLYLGLINANIELNNHRYDDAFKQHEARVEVSND